MEQIIHDFENCLISEGKAKETIRAALRHIKALLQTVSDPRNLTAEIIADWLAQRECLQSTRNQITWSLRKFFKSQGRTDLSFPKQKHVSMKAIRPLTDDEVGIIYQYVNAYCRESLRVVTILRFLGIGLTIKELIELKWDYFKFAEKYLEIPNNQGLTRKLLLDEDLMKLFNWYYEYYDVYSNNVFNVSVGKIERIFAKLRKHEALGEGRRIYPELLRISYACRYLEQGMKLEELQKLMGYKSIRSIRRYLKLMTKDKINSDSTET